MALSPNDCFNEPAYAPEYPASVAFVLRKTRQLRAEIGVQIDAIELAHEALKARVAALEAVAPVPLSDQGSVTVAEANALSKSPNQLFRFTTPGTLTVGSREVKKGDTAIWNGTAWVVIGTAQPDVSEVDVPGASTTLGQLKQIVKDILGAMGRDVS